MSVSRARAAAPPLPVLAAALVVVLLAAPPLLGQGYALTLCTRICVTVVFVLSYHLLYGEAGMLSFGHALYFGAGAYGAVHALNVWGAMVPPALLVTLLPLVGGAAGALAAALAGALNVRRGGLTFAMISLGLAELVLAVVPMLPSVFGGEGGIAADRTAGGMAGGLYASAAAVYVLAAAW